MGNAGALYRPGEVLFLLSLTREQAIDLDAHPADSCSDLSGDPGGSGAGSSADTPLPVIARWHDVHTARRRIVVEHARQQVLAARAQGETEQATAEQTGLTRSTVRRRFSEVLAELVRHLNTGTVEDAEAIAFGFEMCLICGGGPRVRLRTTSRRPKGGWRYRATSVCRECLRPELRGRVAK